VIVGAQTRYDETQILFKVPEYKSEAVNKFTISTLISAPVKVEYVPIHPSRIPNLTDKLKAQVEKGRESWPSVFNKRLGAERKKDKVPYQVGGHRKIPAKAGSFVPFHC
jgi:hypothetical protein